MTRLAWDEVGHRVYETGVSQGVLYPVKSDGIYDVGVPWNGLISVTESPSGAETTPLYADNTKYLNMVSAEEFGATIEAYTYPDKFAACDGSADISTTDAFGVYAGQQTRQSFGLAYVTTVGNDSLGNAYGKKYHLIYGCLAAPSERAYSTINDSPEAITFSWEITTVPVTVEDFLPTASITIDGTKLDASQIAALEDSLFGDSSTGTAKLELPDALLAIIVAAESVG
jgi:hypothetical protein